MTLPIKLSDLIDFDKDNFRVTSREGKNREFKESFKKADLVDYSKTLAAMANADGGVIIFGVTDKPRVIEGFPANQLCDEADIVSHLRDSFHPEIPFEAMQYQHGEDVVFAICVERSMNPPIICRKGRSKRVFARDGTQQDKQITTEGSIYFRYSAQSRNIDYSELRALLDEREQRRMQSIMETLKAVEKVGYEKVGIVDATTISKADGLTSLYISKEASKSMNFIDKGKFVESPEEGSPAYVVVGQVSLKEIVHAPLENADRNLPTDVARILKPLIREMFGAQQNISAGKVTQLTKHFKLDVMPYHEHDKKINRRYTTRAGIEKLKEKIRENPLEAIRSFAGRRDIERYEATL